MVGSDLVSLEPYANYIADPSKITALLEQQGVQGVDSVEVGEPLGGGTSTAKYTGYIHWIDGTQTKVVIKGRRPGEFATASYRESLFYSRITDGLQNVKSPGHYLAVADVSNGDCLMLQEFMSGYISLEDVYTAYATGTLEDLGINPADFNMVEN